MFKTGLTALHKRRPAFDFTPLVAPATLAAVQPVAMDTVLSKSRYQAMREAQDGAQPRRLPLLPADEVPRLPPQDAAPPAAPAAP
ncbi:hypothetical protein [Azohydromonas lata]|uniref:hypothetical protein n=1 Tax=Azohydromonas lata TaxID=45677 RepID=UPI0008304342|nr:hypothetical protein [Azohydromonas lata]